MGKSLRALIAFRAGRNFRAKEQARWLDKRTTGRTQRLPAFPLSGSRVPLGRGTASHARQIRKMAPPPPPLDGSNSKQCSQPSDMKLPTLLK